MTDQKTFALALAWAAATLGAPQLATAQSPCTAEVLLGDLSAGVPGPNLWTPDGAAVLGGPFSFQVRGGPAGARGVLFLGDAPGQPGGSGPLFHPANVFKRLAFELDASGVSAPLFVSGAVGAEACGRELVAQALMRDPVAAGVVHYSNAVRIVAGSPRGPLFGDARFAAGESPVAAVDGDFDGDGLADLAVLAAGQDPWAPAELSILINDGDLGFEPRVVYPAGSQPRALAAADLGGDGVLDLVVANADDRLSVLLGAGDGSFGAPNSFLLSAGGAPSALALGDFDRDGLLDLAVANRDTDDVSILLGFPGGAFGTPASFPAGSGPEHLTVADLDLDGELDLVVATAAADEVAVLFGDGDGAFSAPVAHAVGASPVWVTVGHVNQDGFPDLAVANRDGDSVSVLRASGGGAFDAASFHPVGSAPTAVVLEDVDADGVLDLLTTNSGDGEASVLLGTGGPVGHFAFAGAVRTGAEPAALLFADFGGGGAFELVTVNSGSDDVGLLTGVGDGSFVVGSTVAVGPTNAKPGSVGFVGIADLNGDTYGDLITSLLITAKAKVVLGLGSQSFEAAKVVPALSGANAGVVITDLDLDGHLDLVAPSSTADELLLALGNGDGSFTKLPVLALDQSTQSPAAADMNGDGLPDLVVPLDSGTRVYLGNGDGTFGPALIGPAVSSRRTAVTDVDLDGDLDVVLLNQFTNLVIQLNDGAGNLTSGTTIAAVGNLYDLALGDLDGDGIGDLLGFRRQTTVLKEESANSVLVFLGNGAGGFAAPVTYAAGLNGARETHLPQARMAIGDVDGDGALDVVVPHTGRAAITLLRGRGDGTLHAPESYGAGPTPFHSAIGDLDANGVVELAVTNYGANLVSVLWSTVGG